MKSCNPSVERHGYIRQNAVTVRGAAFLGWLFKRTAWAGQIRVVLDSLSCDFHISAYTASRQAAFSCNKFAGSVKTDKAVTTGLGFAYVRVRRVGRPSGWFGKPAFS